MFELFHPIPPSKQSDQMSAGTSRHLIALSGVQLRAWLWQER